MSLTALNLFSLYYNLQLTITLLLRRFLIFEDPMDEVIVSDCLEYGILPWMLASDAGLQSLSFVIPAVLNGLRLHCITQARLHRRTCSLLKDWGVLQNDGK